MIDGSDLRPGDRFKCAKCKKLMKFGPKLFDERYASSWRMWRVVLLVGCIGATVWVVTLGYDFGRQTQRWTRGFGGALLMWLVVVGCIALAARTMQNNGVLVGVTAMMAGVSLFFLERLGRHVGYEELAEWRRFRFFGWWVPLLIVAGLTVLVASLVVQGRCRSV